jgi:Tol biopolymer transport system component
MILRDPAVSPDGRLVAYDRKAVDGRRSIWISPITGGAPARLTQTSAGEAVPTWSPDSKWLAFLYMGMIILFASCLPPSEDDPVTHGNGDDDSSPGVWKFTVDIDQAKVDVESAEGTGTTRMWAGWRA